MSNNKCSECKEVLEVIETDYGTSVSFFFLFISKNKLTFEVFNFMNFFFVINYFLFNCYSFDKCDTFTKFNFFFNSKDI